ncbi:MAG: sortase [Actinomycetota bacterium]|nr:sortase [Actinomycetota bacterium]
MSYGDVTVRDFAFGKPRKSATITTLSSYLLYMATVIVLFIVFMLWGTNLLTSVTQRSLLQTFQHQISTNSYGDVANGSVIGSIAIPKIGLNMAFVQGTSESDLIEGPGHYLGTALPGQSGNVAIAGHRTTYGAPFYNLDMLAIGDKIFLTTHTGQFVYVVTGKTVVLPSNTEVLNPTKAATLTLTTCNPRFSATTRLVVEAKLSGSATSKSDVVISRKTTVATSSSVNVKSVRGTLLTLIPAVIVSFVAITLITKRRRFAKKVRYSLVSILIPLSYLLWLAAFFFGGRFLPGSF